MSRPRRPRLKISTIAWTRLTQPPTSSMKTFVPCAALEETSATGAAQNRALDQMASHVDRVLGNMRDIATHATSLENMVVDDKEGLRDRIGGFAAVLLGQMTKCLPSGAMSCRSPLSSSICKTTSSQQRRKQPMLRPSPSVAIIPARKPRSCWKSFWRLLEIIGLLP